MKGPEASARAALAAVVRKDIAAVERLTSGLHILSSDAPYSETAGAGYALHNIYGALENSFDQISRTFENHVVDTSRWHRELMLKMFLAIPGLRPAVVPENLQGALNDLRSFRHLFRHGYDFHISPAANMVSSVYTTVSNKSISLAPPPFAGRGQGSSRRVLRR
jgi:hypothetical protein